MFKYEDVEAKYSNKQKQFKKFPKTITILCNENRFIPLSNMYIFKLIFYDVT